MKLKQKIMLGSVAGLLTFGTVLPLEQNPLSTVAAATTGKLTIARNAFVYDKHGKRIKQFGKKKQVVIKKGAEVNYRGKLQPVANDSKQFYLLNSDNYTQTWLPYRKIKSQCYYRLSTGQYIRANNVAQIAGQPLYANKVKVTVAKKVNEVVGTGKDKKTLKPGKTYQVDRITAITENDKPVVQYRISGTTDAFIPEVGLQKKPTQSLKTYTKATYVTFKNAAGTYNIDAAARSNTEANSTFLVGDLYPVEQLTYLWDSEAKKAELYYLLKDSWNEPTFYSSANYRPLSAAGLVYVKASDVNYLSGTYLKPNNTKEEARADAAIATNEDKQSLKQLVEQEKIEPYKNEQTNKRDRLVYNCALTLAKKVLDSDKATKAEVKTAVNILTSVQNDLLNRSEAQVQTAKILNATTPYLSAK